MLLQGLMSARRVTMATLRSMVHDPMLRAVMIVTIVMMVMVTMMMFVSLLVLETVIQP